MIMWLFKHGKISILFAVMIFVIRYFGETHGKTFSPLKLDVLKERGKKSVKRRRMGPFLMFCHNNNLSQCRGREGGRERKGFRILLMLS